MAGSMSMATFILMASTVMQADQCSDGGERKSSNERQNVVLLLQTKLQMNVREQSVEDAKAIKCSSGDTRQGDVEPQSGVSLLQTKLQVNGIKNGVEAKIAAPTTAEGGSYLDQHPITKPPVAKSAGPSGPIMKKKSAKLISVKAATHFSAAVWDDNSQLVTWGKLLSLLLLSLALMWTKIRGSPETEEESPAAMLETYEDLDSLDRTVTTNKFVSMSQQSLYGVAMIMVCLAHWLPHDLIGVSDGLPGLQMSTWSRTALGLIAASHTTMSLIFVLTGYANSVSEKPTCLGNREGLLLLVYLLMALPLAVYPDFAVYHRWTLLWLIIFKVVLCVLVFVRVSPLVQIFLAFAAAYPLAHVPDSIHSLVQGWTASHGISASALRDRSLFPLQDPSLFLVNEFFYWSLGHKVYWFGLYLMGHHFGPRLTPLLQAHPEILLKLLQCKVRCCMAFGLLATWVLQRSFTMPFDPALPVAIADWPGFFTPSYVYPVNIFLDVAQVMFLMLTVGAGNVVLQTCGQGVIGTYVTHVHFSLGVHELASKSTIFATLGVVPMLGGLLQLACIIAFPVADSITIGYCSKCLLFSSFRVATETKPLQRTAETISQIVEQLQAQFTSARKASALASNPEVSEATQ